MRANQLMSKEVVCLRPIETVDAVMSVLRDYDHNCFPVVEDRDQRVLLGTVHRYVYFPALSNCRVRRDTLPVSHRSHDYLPYAQIRVRLLF